MRCRTIGTVAYLDLQNGGVECHQSNKVKKKKKMSDFKIRFHSAASLRFRSHRCRACRDRTVLVDRHDRDFLPGRCGDIR